MSTYEFPPDFFWGAATAGHQVEGGNVNSSMWHNEWRSPDIFHEPSGDACDSYHRYPEDIELLANAGLDVYRFSVEWSRIEPEQGFYSRAALDHYRRMCDVCHAVGVRPFITLNHFVIPRWLGRGGGFKQKESAQWFADYSQVVADHLGDLVWQVATFNEPNMAALLMSQREISPKMIERFGADGAPMVAVGETVDTIVAAHRAAKTPWNQREIPVGWTLAMPSFHGVDGGEDSLDERRGIAFDPFLDVSRDDDFVGVQGYSRERFGPDGHLGPPEDAELMETGWEVYPAAIAESARYAWERSGVDIVVSENGMATPDDEKRIANTGTALTHLHSAIADGLPLKGYIHWTLLDNWEWHAGFEKHFGLIEVDLETFERRPKPSLAWLGQVAQRNGLTS